MVVNFITQVNFRVLFTAQMTLIVNSCVLIRNFAKFVKGFGFAVGINILYCLGDSQGCCLRKETDLFFFTWNKKSKRREKTQTNQTKMKKPQNRNKAKNPTITVIRFFLMFVSNSVATLASLLYVILHAFRNVYPALPLLPFLSLVLIREL